MNNHESGQEKEGENKILQEALIETGFQTSEVSNRSMEVEFYDSKNHEKEQLQQENYDNHMKEREIKEKMILVK